MKKKVNAPVPTEAQKAGSRRVFQSGAYASALAVVVLVAVILLNLVIGAIPTKYTEFDISSGQMFTLSDTTINLLNSLDRDVTAYYLGQSGNEDSNITRILDRYAGESSHFSWQQRDPAVYPTFAQQYDAADASADSVILVCGDKSTVVDYSDMYSMDYSDYYTTGSYSYEFAAENALTTGISQVIQENSYQLYQMTGHGETALGSDFTDALSNSGVSVTELNFVTAGSVPEDASVVLINNPQADYSTTDVDALRSFLENGGSVIVTTDLTYETPNLDALLAEYGLSRQAGLLVEGDQNYYAYRYPQTYLLPEIQNNEITSGITNGMYVFTPVAQALLTDSSKEDLTYTTLLSTSSDSYAMQDYATAETAQKGENDPAGPLNVGVAAENGTTGGKVVWIGCGNVFLTDMNTAVSGGNAQLLGSIVNWMNGEDNAVVIDAKSMNAETLTVPATATMALGLGLVIVLPLAILIAGVAVAIVRRRR